MSPVSARLFPTGPHTVWAGERGTSFTGVSSINKYFTPAILDRVQPYSTSMWLWFHVSSGPEKLRNRTHDVCGKTVAKYVGRAATNRRILRAWVGYKIQMTSFDIIMDILYSNLYVRTSTITVQL